jgi:hypothetical protein
VILIDANILIYSHVTSFAQHKLARDWLDEQLNTSAPVGLPWASLLGFLRLVMNPRVFEHPEPIGDAWKQVRAWLSSESPSIPQPTERQADFFGRTSRVTWRPPQSGSGCSSRGIGGGARPNALLHRRRLCAISAIAMA